KEKGLDLICANDVTSPESGFARDANKVVLLDRSGKVENLPLLPKYEVAHKVLDRVVKLLAKRV
ncbi:MAG: bifunctional 4'-phosphopantothenoylcysteine decarboxylase/phosphopantothenoylcysteine synthetase, partial [Nitrospinota bacterium]